MLDTVSLGDSASHRPRPDIPLQLCSDLPHLPPQAKHDSNVQHDDVELSSRSTGGFNPTGVSAAFTGAPINVRRRTSIYKCFQTRKKRFISSCHSPRHKGKQQLPEAPNHLFTRPQTPSGNTRGWRLKSAEIRIRIEQLNEFLTSMDELKDYLKNKKRS